MNVLLPKEGDDWTHVSALGWNEDQYLTVPVDIRNHILACQGVRECERVATTTKSRIHYRDAREILETHFALPSEIENPVKSAREILLSLVDRHITQVCLPVDFVKEVLQQDNDLRNLSTDARYCEGVQMYALEKVQFSVRMALDEAFANHLKHGVQGDPRGIIEGKGRIANGVAEFVTKDSGKGFIPEHVQDSHDNLEKPSGRGIFLMKYYMDFVGILDNGSKYHMTKQMKDGIQLTIKKQVVFQSWKELVLYAGKKFQPEEKEEKTE